jgi:amino acid transporter
MYISAEKKEQVPQPVQTRKKISVVDAVAIVAGMVIGPGIFKTPGLVASFSGNESITLALWAAGGLISFIGALCYAELASTYPNTGGEYYFLHRAYGSKISFLFAWARMTIIQTGSIAMLSFLIGDYFSEIFRLGIYSSSIYAALTVVVLTGINIKGLHPSTLFQKLLIGCLLASLFVLVIAGIFTSSPSGSSSIGSKPAIGQAMIFILLTYGGWNEAAYLSAETGKSSREIIKVLFYSIALITGVYLTMNYAFIAGLGFSNVAGADAVAADLAFKAGGEVWLKLISLVVAFAAFSTVNAVMLTGARTNYALGRDHYQFKFLSNWKINKGVPLNAFLLQAGISLVLVLFGTATKDGFVTMVEYTAPVFWFFLLLIGISLFILRKKNPVPRTFNVLFYPFTPLLFCAAAAFMLYSSLVYTGTGAFVGVLVLCLAIPFLLIKSKTIKENNYETL